MVQILKDLVGLSFMSMVAMLFLKISWKLAPVGIKKPIYFLLKVVKIICELSTLSVKSLKFIFKKANSYFKNKKATSKKQPLQQNVIYLKKAK